MHAPKVPGIAIFQAYRALFYAFLFGRRALAELRPERSWRTWITKEILLGGFLLPSDVTELERLGVKAVLNATSELVEPMVSLSAAGIEVLQIPCWDMRCPSDADIDRAIAFIDARIAAGQRVYVHCASGVGRSVVVCASWLALRRGTSAEEAIAWIGARRRISLSERQRRFVTSYVASRRARPENT